MENRFETFTALMTSIGRSIRKIKTMEMADFRLKGTHALCLYYLYREDALTATELCELCEEDKANISRTIEYLKRNDYIACADGTARRYRSTLTLTEKGREAGARILEKIEKVLELSDEGISEENRRIMYEGLRRVDENLQRLCVQYEKQSKGER